MTQPDNDDAAMPAGVVTVADLLSRYSPLTAVSEPEPPAAPVTVASLLRREGVRDASTVTGFDPMENGAAVGRNDGGHEDAPRSGAFVRRGAIAAGVLLAAGSAVGVTLVSTSAPVEPAPAALADDSLAGPWLDPQSTPAATALPLPSPVAEQLDPGAAPDQPWSDVAFPPGGDEPDAGGLAAGNNTSATETLAQDTSSNGSDEESDGGDTSVSSSDSGSSDSTDQGDDSGGRDNDDDDGRGRVGDFFQGIIDRIRD